MSYWHEHIKIANLSFPRFIGGPLDGITDSPFRRLVREFSTEELLYSEMRHVACVAHDKAALNALKFDVFERPLNYQVSANKPEFIPAACQKILEKGIDMVDLNIGCPANNVVKSGSGSALMADLPRLEQILKIFRAELPVPFTVKIRAGFKCKNAVDVAKLIQDCGADAIAIHPRLQTQRFEGRPDYLLAAEVKRAVSLPIIISGGVVNWATAKMVYEQTGVDGFLIGRGIWSRPWKLLELKEHSQGRPYAISQEMMLSCALKHLEYMMEYYGQRGLYNFRKHVPFYIRGVQGAAQIREKIVTAQSVEEVKSGLHQAFGLLG